MRVTFLAILVALGFCNPAIVGAQPMVSPPRGELLYSTFCVACHTTQMHWRDKRIATDLPSLTQQVRRWHTNAGQSWSEADIDEVVRHLNRIYYRFPAATEKG